MFIYYLLLVFITLSVVSCGKQTQAQKAATPEPGIVKLICQCQDSLIQGQGSSQAEAKNSALKKCQIATSSQSTVSQCEEIN